MGDSELVSLLKWFWNFHNLTQSIVIPVFDKCSSKQRVADEFTTKLITSGCGDAAGIGNIFLLVPSSIFASGCLCFLWFLWFLWYLWKRSIFTIGYTVVSADTVNVYQDVGAVSGKDLTHSALGDVIKVVK